MAMMKCFPLCVNEVQFVEKWRKLLHFFHFVEINIFFSFSIWYFFPFGSIENHLSFFHFLEVKWIGEIFSSSGKYKQKYKDIKKINSVFPFCGIKRHWWNIFHFLKMEANIYIYIYIYIFIYIIYMHINIYIYINTYK